MRYHTYEVLKAELNNDRIKWAYLPYSMHMAGQYWFMCALCFPEGSCLPLVACGHDMYAWEAMLCGRPCHNAVS